MPSIVIAAAKALPRLLVAAALAGSIGGLSALAAGERTWNVDPVHSSAEFTVTHLGITHVRGTIPIKSAVVRTGGSGLVPASVEAELDLNGIDTKNDRRDNDLKSDNFFDTAKYPVMTFKSTSVKAGGDKDFTLTGNLTMHGVTKVVALKGRCDGQGKDLKGRPIVAYEANGTLDRRDWNMNNYFPVVSNDIDISLTVEADATPASP